MLHAMLLNDELRPYFVSGRVRSEVMVAEILAQLKNYKLDAHSDERDSRVRSELGNEKADLIVGKDWKDKVLEYDEPIDAYDGFVFADLGFIHHGTIDWETGDMICEYIPERRERPDYLFSGIEDLIASEYDRNEVTAEFRGMHLAREKVELLLPTHRLPSGDGKGFPVSFEAKHVGRPRIWDWEGALAYIVSQAQTPDGLPTGPGSQARIEAMIANWFEAQTGNSPSVSQIRTRAANVIRMIEKG